MTLANTGTLIICAKGEKVRENGAREKKEFFGLEGGGGEKRNWICKKRTAFHQNPMGDEWQQKENCLKNRKRKQMGQRMPIRTEKGSNGVFFFFVKSIHLRFGDCCKSMAAHR